MPTLNWIGKEAVVNHDKEVPFRLLKKVKSASVDENSQNLIVHGDNLEALKALMPFYIGKINCIYIDPPYNTGKENWIYNDKVNSPKIKRWIKKVVGEQGQDLCRHDKWLCMMYPRLKLLHDLLAEDGVIFISLDDNEQSHLKILLDEIFGETNFIQNFMWLHGKGKKDKNSRTLQQYILSYAKNKEILPEWKVEKLKEYNSENPDNDPRGDWFSGSISFSEDRSNKSHDNYFSITSPSGIKWTRQWQCTKSEMDDYLKNNKIYFGNPPEYKNVPRIKIFPTIEQIIPPNIIDGVGTTKSAQKEVDTLLKGEITFDNPKPVKLIKHLIKMSSKQNDIIMDSFAGSGTTGQAVLDLNKEDGGNRKFILVEMEDEVAKDITAERVKRAIKKYDYKDGFEYCELSKPLFDEDGQIEETCDFKQFATYIYFTETQTNIDPAKISGNIIGEHNEVEYYLIYKEKGINMLSKSFLKKLRKNDSTKIVYADKCMLDNATLEKYNIVFKQIPYEVKVY